MNTYQFKQKMNALICDLFHGRKYQRIIVTPFARITSVECPRCHRTVSTDVAPRI